MNNSQDIIFKFKVETFSNNVTKITDPINERPLCDPKFTQTIKIDPLPKPGFCDFLTGEQNHSIFRRNY